MQTLKEALSHIRKQRVGQLVGKEPSAEDSRDLEHMRRDMWHRHGKTTSRKHLALMEKQPGMRSREGSDAALRPSTQHRRRSAGVSQSQSTTPGDPSRPATDQRHPKSHAPFPASSRPSRSLRKRVPPQFCDRVTIAPCQEASEASSN